MAGWPEEPAGAGRRSCRATEQNDAGLGQRSGLASRPLLRVLGIRHTGYTCNTPRLKYLSRFSNHLGHLHCLRPVSARRPAAMVAAAVTAGFVVVPLT